MFHVEAGIRENYMNRHLFVSNMLALMISKRLEPEDSLTEHLGVCIRLVLLV